MTQEMNSHNQVLIIGRNFHPDGKETAATIADALQPLLAAKNIDVHFVHIKDVLFDISNQAVKIIDATSGRSLDTFQAVLMTNWFSHASVRKDLAYSLALYFQQNNIPCFNSEALHSRSTSKISQMMIAAQNGVPIARTVFSLTLAHAQKYLEETHFTTPIIFKDAQASRGKGNYLLHSLAEISQHSTEHSETHPFIVQECIDSDGSDYRFFVAGGTTRLVIKRIGSGDSHLNNTSAGASTQIIAIEKFESGTLEHVHAMSKLLHRELTGIDIMFDKRTDAPYFLEANPIPQIATGSNIPLKLEALAVALEESILGEKV